jgi:Toastrack DUF4097
MVFGSISVLAFVGFGTFNVVSLLAHEERDEHATLDAATIALVEVHVSAGRVDVEEATGDTIDIAAHVSDGLQRTRLSWDADGSTLDVRATCPALAGPWCRTDLTLRVPRSIAVVVDSDDGRVTVSGRDGAVTVNADNGRVELADVAGPVVVDSDNGRVAATGLSSPSVDVDTDNGRIDLVFVATPDAVTAASDNGGIDIAVPAGSEPFAVTTSSDGGSRTVEVPTDPAAPRTITARTGGGNVRIHQQ